MQNIQRIYIFALLWLASLTLNAQVTATITHVKAPNKGSIVLQVAGANAPYTYYWYKKGNFNNKLADTKDLTNLDAGEYCVLIHDSKCCSAEQCFIVKDECSGDYVKVTYKKNVSTCGEGKLPPGTNGKIEIEVLNPADYTYCWKQFQNDPVCAFTTQNIDQLGVGDYYLTVTNKNTGCKVKLETSLCCCYDSAYDPDVEGSTPSPFVCHTTPGLGLGGPLNVNVTPTPPTSADNDGVIVLNISGGRNPNYTIKWTGPNGFKSTEPSISGLVSGTYCYTVTDGCSEKKDCIEMYVCGDNPINLSLTIETKPCNYVRGAIDDRNKGVIGLNISGGKPPYKIKWNNGKDTKGLSGISAGTYCVVVTDKSGCTASGCVTLANGEVIPNKSTLPCQNIVKCDTRKIETIYGDPYYVPDNIDCTLYNEYCSITGMKTGGTSPNPNPPGHTTVDNFCTIWWNCPNGFKKVIGNAIPSSTTSFEFDPLCNCGACIKTDFCSLFGENIKIIKRTRVSPTSGKIIKTSECASNCGQQVLCGSEIIGVACLSASFCGAGKSAPTIVFNSNITLGDYILGNYKQEDRVFFEKDRIFVPKGVTAQTKMTDFEIITAESSENPNTEYDELDLSDYTPTICEKRTCEYIATEVIGGEINAKIQSNNNPKSESVQLYPNPTEGLLNIEIPYKLYPKSSIEILNTLGQKVYTRECGEQTNISVDMAKFVQGAYTVIVRDCNNQQVFNEIIIKQ